MSHDSQTEPCREPHFFALAVRLPRKQGIRTHVLLVVAMAVVTLIVTALFLVLLRHRSAHQVTDRSLPGSQPFSHHLPESSDRAPARARSRERASFRSAHAEGADDQRRRSHHSGWGGRVLADSAAPICLHSPMRSGRVVAAYTKKQLIWTFAQVVRCRRCSPLRRSTISSTADRCISARCARSTSAAHENGTLLGYVVSGVSIERTVRQISPPTGVEADVPQCGQRCRPALSLPRTRLSVQPSSALWNNADTRFR